MNANWPEIFRREINGEKEEMSTFERNFDIAKIGEDRLMRDLLSYWRPAGADAGDNGLRIAIRDKYINFYRKGKSVAKVSVPNGQVKAEVHGKYIDKEQSSQQYKTFRANDYDEKVKDQIIRWISTASGYKGDEKKFVDLLVGSNPNVIDLEMTLPFDESVHYTREPKKTGTKVAIRMDLVTVEKINGIWTVVFWEAKLAQNKEARRGDDGMPRVVAQLKNYEAWIQQNRDVVVQEYIKTCDFLCKFHSLASKNSLNIPPLGEGILAVADTKQLNVDLHPRLVIDNRTNYFTFESNGHLAKLRSENIHVQMVESDGDFVLESHR